MATQPEAMEEFDDDQDLDLDEPDTDVEQDGGEEDGDADASKSADDAEFVGFEDEPDQQPVADNTLVRHLRQQIRERDKKLAEANRSAPVVVEEAPEPKPTLEQFDYDPERYEAARDAWDECNVDRARRAAAREEADRKREADWQGVVTDFTTKKAALRFADRDTVIEMVTDTLPGTAQAIIAKNADNAALLMYAVGKSPAKLAELERIADAGDPFALVKAITKMEAALTTKRSGARPPNPDQVVRGRPISASGDKHLQKLQAEAAKSGDRSKVAAYLRDNRSK